MKHKPTTRYGIEHPPKLVPAGSVNRILLLGDKNLTMFQSLGLLFIGLCVAGIGGSFFLILFRGEHLYAIEFPFATALLFIWGLVMLFNGVRGVARRLRLRQTL